jgi:hypothetical protein
MLRFPGEYIRRSLNAPQLPSQPSPRDDLTERASPPVQRPNSALSLAGFQVFIYRRFWVNQAERRQ